MDDVREDGADSRPTEAPPPTVSEVSPRPDRKRFDWEAFAGSERTTRFLYYLCGGVFITLIFRKLQFYTPSICCGDQDGYYHIRWSWLLWQNFKAGHILPPKFTWLPLTELNPQRYVDHHYLFHLLQIPFLWFFSLPTAAKISAVVFASLAVFACYWLVMRHRLSYPLLWLLALVGCSAPFLYRMNMAKAPPIAIVFMVVGINLLFQAKYRWLAPLMFLFVWTYSLFPTLLLAAMIWTVVLAWSERRFEWRPLAFTAGGMVAGLLINPYFPKNIVLLYAHVAMKVTASGYSVPVGQEWYSYDSWELLGSCLIAFIAMLIGYVTFGRSDRHTGRRPLFFLLFSTVLMIGVFRWKRFVEYWPPFAILFAAFSLQVLFDEAKARLKAKEDLFNDLSPFLDKPSEESVKAEQLWQIVRLVSAGLIGVALFVIIVLTVAGFKHFGADLKGVGPDIADSAPPDQYKKGMEWIWANVPPGEVIFNTDWDDFPKLFFYDQNHAYVSGLDPTYLYDRDHELYKLYEDITLGKVKDPGPLIRDKFGAHYVFSDQNGHDDLYIKAMESGWFDKVYEDEDCFILKLRDTKGPVPDEAQDDGSDNGDDSNGDNSGDDEPDNGGGENGTLNIATP
jgi:hypothetical protein